MQDKFLSASYKNFSFFETDTNAKKQPHDILCHAAVQIFFSAQIFQHQMLANSFCQRIRNHSDLIVAVCFVKFKRSYIEIADGQ